MAFIWPHKEAVYWESGKCNRGKVFPVSCPSLGSQESRQASAWEWTGLVHRCRIFEQRELAFLFPHGMGGGAAMGTETVCEPE